MARLDNGHSACVKWVNYQPFPRENGFTDRRWKGNHPNTLQLGARKGKSTGQQKSQYKFIIWPNHIWQSNSAQSLQTGDFDGFPVWCLASLNIIFIWIPPPPSSVRGCREGWSYFTENVADKTWSRAADCPVGCPLVHHQKVNLTNI